MYSIFDIVRERKFMLVLHLWKSLRTKVYVSLTLYVFITVYERQLMIVYHFLHPVKQFANGSLCQFYIFYIF